MAEETCGPDRCECGKPSEPGSYHCHQCQHEGPRPPRRPDPLAQAAMFRRTAAMLRSLRTVDTKARVLALDDAAYFDKRAEALEAEHDRASALDVPPVRESEGGSRLGSAAGVEVQAPGAPALPMQPAGDPLRVVPAVCSQAAREE